MLPTRGWFDRAVNIQPRASPCASWLRAVELKIVPYRAVSAAAVWSMVEARMF